MKKGLKEKSFFEFSPEGDTIIKGNYKNNLKIGLWRFYDNFGNISCEKNYLKGLLDGESKCYHENGNTSSITFYKDGKKKNETLYFTKGGKPYTPANYNGGQNSMMAYLAKNTKYPAEAIDKNIQGRAYISFTVKSDGSVSNIMSAAPPGREVHKRLVKEAIRVVKSMPHWNPAISEGKPISCTFTVPVNFRIR